ncbi:hypothetical protein APSETT445_003861 [Aspergillus pseudonomiae]
MTKQEEVLAEYHENAQKVEQSEQDVIYQTYVSQSPEWHRKMTRQLLRKVDVHLLPCLIVMYLLNFLDRNNLSQARLGTLEKDLNMKGTDYNLATSILFVGYLLMQLPSNLLLTRVRPSLFLGITMAIWGVISACQAATHSFTGLVLARFFLGFVEAPFFPGAIMLILLLPNYPATTSWLDETEKLYAQWRLIHDAGEADEAKSNNLREALWLVFSDKRIYLFILLQHTSLLSQNFQYFFPTIVQTLGYGNIETLLITAPVWIATFIVSLLVTWSSGRTNDRGLHIISLMLVSVVGCVICTATTNIGAKFFGMFLMPMGAVSAYQIIIAWVANSFPRPLVKRSAAIATANMIGNTASIYGSYMWPSSAGPRYIAGGSATAGIALLVAILAFVIRMVHARMNRRLDMAQESDQGEAGGLGGNHTGIRYIL